MNATVRSPIRTVVRGRRLRSPLGPLLDDVTQGLGPQIAPALDQWTMGLGWSFVAGTLRSTVALGLLQTPNLLLEPGKLYQVTVEVESMGAGALRVEESSGNVISAVLNLVGTLLETLIPTDPARVIIRPTLALTATISGISIREVINK